MKVNSLNTANYISFIPKNNISLAKYTADTFCKKITPSFKSADKRDELGYESFLKWAQDTDFISLVDSGEHKGKLLGKGFESSVYELPNTDKWVMKEYRRAYILPFHIDKPDISEIHDPFPDFNVGQMIARVEVPRGTSNSNVFYILKNQEGMELGVDRANSANISDSNISVHLNSLALLSTLPQSSYDKLLIDAEKLYSKGYELDCANLNNFLLDKRTNSINFVDTDEGNTPLDVALGSILYALLDTEFAINFEESDADASKKAQAQNYSDKIIKKYFKAMTDSGKKFQNGYFFDRLLHSKLLDRVLGSEDYDEKIEALDKRNLCA